MAGTLWSKVTPLVIKRVFVIAFWAALIFFGVLAFHFWPDSGTWSSALSGKTLLGGAIVVALHCIEIVFRGLRWRAMLKPDVVVSPFRIVPVFAWCFLLNGVFPYRTGEAARLVWVNRFGGTVGFGLGALAAERVIDLIFVFGLAGIAVLAIPGLAGYVTPWVGVYLAAMVLAFTMAVVWAAPLKNLLSRVATKRSSKSLAFIAECVGAIEVIRHRDQLLPTIALTAGLWGVYSLAYYGYIIAFFPNASFVVAVAVAAAVTMSAIIPLVPANVGVFEASVIFVLVTLGHDEQVSLILAATIHGLFLFTASVFGGIGWYFCVRRVNVRNDS